MSDFDLIYKGGDVAFLIDNFSDTLKEFVRTYVVGQMDKSTRKALEGMINDMLLKEPREIDVDKNQVEIDYRLLGEGIYVTNEYLSVIMDGTVTATSEIGKNNGPKDKYTKMPLHDTDGAEIQVLVSEYTLNTVLQTAVDLNVVEFSNS